MDEVVATGFIGDADRLSVVMATAVDGMIIIDDTGGIQVFNPACERLFGYRADEVIGRNVKMLMPPPYREEHDGYLHNYRESGEKKIIGIGREVAGQRQDGSTFPMELSVGEAVHDAQRIYVGIIRDITERKAAESTLRESEARMRAVIDTAVDGVIIIDARANIRIFNPACERLFGYTSDEVIGRNVKMLMPSPYKDEHDGYVSNYRTTGVKKIIGIGREVTGQRKDGSTFPMELSVGEAEEQGAPVFVGIIRDITERKAAEQEIERNVRELAAFSYSVAHDLKAPLRSIEGFSTALAEDYGDALPEDGKTYLNFVTDGVTHMGKMIDDLLEYSRVGRDELPFTPVALRSVVGNAIKAFSQTIKEKDAEIAVDGEWVKIEGHWATLESIFLNLVGNALKFTRPDTRPRIEITSKDFTNTTEITVTDNGIGIPEDCREKVFQIFHRLNDRAEYQGTGIGLAIVRKGITLHRGDIVLADSPEGGVRFTITLPKRKYD